MSNSNAPRTTSMRVRAMTVAGGIALIGATGAGLAGTANAASTSSASSTLAKIKYCESGGNYQAVNSSSGASGAYQFLNSTWKGLSASAGYATAASAPASVQDAAALELYNEAGTSPWAASSSCWSSMTTTPTPSGASTSTTSAASTAASSTAATLTTTASTKAASSKAALTQATSSKAASAKPAPVKGTPHGKGANKPAPKGHGPQGGKHHATPDAPKPPKKTGNQLPPKTGAHQPSKPGDVRHIGHGKLTPHPGHPAAATQPAPAKAAAKAAA